MAIEVKSTNWQERTRAALLLYRDELLRQVAVKLTRPRQRRTIDDLREHLLEGLENPISIDRALKSVSPAARRILALIDFSGTYRWPLQALVDLLPVVGFTDGLRPIKELLDAGVLFPHRDGTIPLESFDSWLSQAASERLTVFTLPTVAERCRNEPLELDGPVGEKSTKLVPVHSDGLEWPLRLFIVWQIVHGNPLRLTQAGSYFKRDLDRLRANPLLGTQPAETPVSVADPAMLAIELARQVGLLRCERDELHAEPKLDVWMDSTSLPMNVLWPALCRIVDWDPVAGLRTENGSLKRPTPIGLVIMAALFAAPAQNWINPNELAEWVIQRQPDFGRDPAELTEWGRSFLGVMHSVGAVEIAKAGDDWHVRLSTAFRNQLSNGQSNHRATATPTLLVQPNLEIVLFRQGLTPELGAILSRIAEWKQLGLACTLSLNAESVYRGLETGISFDEIVRTLNRHSTRPLPESVLETLRSWSTKRERVQVYSSAMLLEFRTPDELQQAVKQGLVEQTLTDRIGMVASEKELDYSRFRLVGTRDYVAPEERCVDVETDGLTLAIQDGKADLLLAAEVRRFADPIDQFADDRSAYRMSIESLHQARNDGVDLRWLDDWFRRRTGQQTPSTARMLFLGPQVSPISLDATTILRLPSEEIADGFEEWPAAQQFLIERLGPTTFVVRESSIEQLKKLLELAGLGLK